MIEMMEMKEEKMEIDHIRIEITEIIEKTEIIDQETNRILVVNVRLMLSNTQLRSDLH